MKKHLLTLAICSILTIGPSAERALLQYDWGRRSNSE